MNIDQRLNQLTEKLRCLSLTVATAESCTGGLVSSLLTDLPGSSNWFEQGFITYSDRAKASMLGVSQMLLSSEGAVSRAVAEAMALGVLEKSFADLSMAVTGFAGPSGGTAEKPVGTVFFAWAMRGHSLAKSLGMDFSCIVSRYDIRIQASYYLLSGALVLLEHFQKTGQWGGCADLDILNNLK